MPARSASLSCLVVLAALTVAATLAHAAAPRQGALDAALDVRLPERADERAGFRLRLPAPTQLRAAEEFRARHPLGVMRWDGMAASPKWIASAPGSVLAEPAVGTPADAARSFLQSAAPLLGLRTQEIPALRVTDVVTDRAGGAHVHFVQTVAGLDVDGARSIVNLRSDNAVVSAGTSLFAGLAEQPPPSLSAADAVQRAATHAYPERLPPAVIVSESRGVERRTVFEAGEFRSQPTARLMLFPLADGAALAWEVRIAEPSGMTDFRILVDAHDGEILSRQNLTQYATASILDAAYPAPRTEEYQPLQFVTKTFPASTSESPSGWLAGNGTLSGNNATTHFQQWLLPGGADPADMYEYAFNTKESALVNAYWWLNDAHDRFYRAGFDESGGNFQSDNFGLGGLGGDPMGLVSYTMGPPGFRGAAFLTVAPDGGVATVNFSWSECELCQDHDTFPENGGERSVGFSRDVIVHEYTHGVSQRSVGGPSTISCLGSGQAGAMNEGWSDLFPASFYDDPQIGTYYFEGSAWLRDLRHDLNYDDVCQVTESGCQTHSDGMIWAGTLWDLRASMIALDPAGGKEDFHEIAVVGMANMPCFPSFIDGRDGMLAADTALFGSAHHKLIWNAFASRGVGSGASSFTAADPDPVHDFTVPAPQQCSGSPTASLASVVATGPNVLTLTYSTSDASAVEIWRDDVDNTLDTFTRVATTTGLTGYVDGSVQGGKTYAYRVVGIGDAGVTCRSSPSATIAATATGSCSGVPPLFAPAPSFSQTTCTDVRLSWTPATPGCPGSGTPVVYNVYRAPDPGFEPAEQLLIGRTANAFFDDTPPQTGETYYYLVLAEHGLPADPAVHDEWKPFQALVWRPWTAMTSRTVDQSWSFDAGPAGWTADNTLDPSGGWTLVDDASNVRTEYAATNFNPYFGDGQYWVTGSAPGRIAASDSDGAARLISPTWDGSTGAMLIAFDYWAHRPGSFVSTGIAVEIDNGTTTAVVLPVDRHTTQTFLTETAADWQHAELDLSSYIAPSSTMTVTFVANPASPISEFGIDNVQVIAGGVCGRSGLELDSLSLDDSPAGWGNGNGVLEPGETVRLVPVIRNVGDASAVLPTGRLSVSTPGVVVHEPDDSFPTLPPAGTAAPSGAGFTLTLDEGAVSGCGDTVALRFTITDSDGIVSVVPVNLETGDALTSTVFSDDFSTDKGWTVTGDAGKGVWQRGNPVGTFDGGNAANPENDSPNDADDSCYVTENGAVGGPAGASDVDSDANLHYPELVSPVIDLTGFKRVRLSYDAWYYDNSTGASSGEDLGQVAFISDDGVRERSDVEAILDPTGGWTAFSYEPGVEFGPVNRLHVRAFDQDANWGAGFADHLVEMAVDNVRVEGDVPVCVSPGVSLPPNGIGPSLLVSKAGSALLAWTASPIDGTHDAAAYYRSYVSGSAGAGFAVFDTSTETMTGRSLGAGGNIEFYRVVAVNDAGSSGDEPLP